MKLIRYGPSGREKPGLIDADGRLRDLSGIVANIDAGMLAPSRLEHLSRFDPVKLPLVRGAPRLGVPFTGIGKFIGIGLNYSDHAAEAGMPVPGEPIVFLKATTSITGPNDGIMLPKHSEKTDWEVELGVVIGSRAHCVGEAEAMRCVAGYCVVNDVSERSFQLERGGTWDKGKGCDTFGPIGPYLVTADSVPDPHDLDLWLDVNGEPRQRGNTKTMIFGVARLVSYVSQFMTLMPGDVISTGTPPGVGMARKPPQFLRPGDVVTCGIAGLGEQRSRVSAWSPH
jgi:2-keto-4-pentenoate hydratase/2-oxohepta-3-ene-1,7-dioic acid hydratase in catechol pathway